MPQTYDVIIIGAGPAGLTAAVYCGRAALRTLVLGNSYDSQVAKTDIVENYPGFPDGIKGMELIEKMAAQAKLYAENVAERVEKTQKNGDVFSMKTESAEYLGKALFMCTGATHREMGVKGEKEFANKGVSYCAVCDGSLFRGMKVVVAGYGNGAAKAAMYLSGLSGKVTVLCTQSTLKCEIIYLERLKKNKNVEITCGVKLESIEGDSAVKRVRYAEGEKKKVVETDAVFIEYGTVPNSKLAKELGIQLTDKGFIKVNELQETNIKGVFAAGDITGGRRQIATAVGEGANAAISAINYLK
jgi:thioredoxin reductase (NADPH)